MKKITTLLLFSSLSLATTANAAALTQIQPSNTPPKVYVEVTGGINAYYLGIFSTNSDSNTAHAGTGGYGWSAALGYSFTPYVAIEGGFMQNYITIDTKNEGNKKQNTYHTNVPYVTTQFSVPIGTHVEFISKVGLMMPFGTVNTAEDDEPPKNETFGVVLPFTGLGLGYKITPALEINIQYQGAVYGIVGGGLLSGGLDYRF